MIQLSGMPFKKIDMWTSGSVERKIVQGMEEDTLVYSYQSINELSFELKLRKNIIASAKAMNQGAADFEIFATSRCNPKYWDLTNTGGFQLRKDVLPSDAINDIFKNSSLYGFECATAKVIIYYHAVLKSIGKALFNQFFQNLYLYSWHFDPDLDVQPIQTDHFLPGDVVYFNNPDVDPQNAWWRGENAVVLDDGKYFGHGIGIMSSEKIIEYLNKTRKPESNVSAYLMNTASRPAFNHLAQLSMGSQQRFIPNKMPYIIIHHNHNSISLSHYLIYLNRLYKQMTYMNPFIL